MREEFIPVLISLQTLFIPRGLWLLGSKWKHHSQVGYHVMDSRWLHGKILLNFVMSLCSALSSEQQGVVFNLLFNPNSRHTVQGSMTSWTIAVLVYRPTHYRIWGGKKKFFWDSWNNLTFRSSSFFVYCKYEELGICHNGCPLWGALSHYKIWLVVFFFPTQATVTIFNWQQYRHISGPPGWKLSWSWAKNEVIWTMLGAEAISQGDCSAFTTDPLPHSCARTPQIVDLLPTSIPYSEQIANCCKGGMLPSFLQNPVNNSAVFQMKVGLAGTSNKTVQLPQNFTLKSPGPGYTCGPAVKVPPSQFTTDGMRYTEAFSKFPLLLSKQFTCVLLNYCF